MSDESNVKFTEREALFYHKTIRPGKIEIIASKPMATQRDLSLAYSPGVAVPVLAIAADPDLGPLYGGIRHLRDRGVVCARSEAAGGGNRLKTRNAAGQMVPLGSLVKVKESYGPDRVMRYNGYPAAEITGGPAPGVSSVEAGAAMAKLATDSLPKGMSFEWTELTYQRILAGNTAVYIYPLCILLVFLVLAAQYGSHISIVWFLEKIPLKYRRLVIMGNGLILIAAYSSLAWGAFTLMPIVSTERTPVLGVPSSVTYSCFLIAFVLLVLTAVTQSIRMYLTQGMHGRYISSGQTASAFAEH